MPVKKGNTIQYIPNRLMDNLIWLKDFIYRKLIRYLILSLFKIYATAFAKRKSRSIVELYYVLDTSYSTFPVTILYPSWYPFAYWSWYYYILFFFFAYSFLAFLFRFRFTIHFNRLILFILFFDSFITT